MKTKMTVRMVVMTPSIIGGRSMNQGLSLVKG